jgi:ankyrin repeat protein
MQAERDGPDTIADLFKAIETGDLDKVRELLDVNPRLAGARNRDGMSALRWSAYVREPRISDLLLARGPKPDAFEAAALGLVDRLEELVSADRDVVSRLSSDGWTALHLAAHFGRLEAMRVLLSAGASHRAISKNSNANQPLQAAAAGGQAAAVALLLKAGADPDARSHGGFTALHIAAQNGNVEMVDALLEAGADPAAKTDAGKTPMDFAVAADRAQAADRLEKALAASPAKRAAGRAKRPRKAR